MRYAHSEVTVVDARLEAIVAHLEGAITRSSIVFDHGDMHTRVTSMALPEDRRPGVPVSLAEDCQAITSMKYRGGNEKAAVGQRASLRVILANLYGRVEGETVPSVLAPLFEEVA